MCVQQSTRLYLPLFQLVSTPASIVTTGIHSDAHNEHAQYQGWIIGVEYRYIFHPMERSDWFILCAYVISERVKRASLVMFVFNRDFRYVRIYIYIYVHIYWPYGNPYVHARWYVMWAGLSVTTFISIVTTSNEHQK